MSRIQVFFLQFCVSTYSHRELNGTLKELCSQLLKVLYLHAIGMIITKSYNNPQRETLSVNPWAYVTFEAYGGTSSCNELPSLPQLYTEMQLFEASGQVTPNWVVHTTSEPTCGEYPTVVDPETVTLNFKS